MGIYLGTLGDDEINGSTLGDIITALGGNDTVFGRDGADVIDGGSGDDVIYANTQNVWADGDVDTILAGLGDDHVYAGFGDAVNGGFGFDTLSLDMSLAGSGVDVDFRPMTLLDLTDLITISLGGVQLAGFQAIDHVVGSDFGDRIIVGNRDHVASLVEGGAGDDFLRAGNGDDTLRGGDGSDILRGFGKADALAGGEGDDLLVGGRGTDELTGGAGSDRFYFNDGDLRVSRNFADTITDFSHGQGDKLVLRPMDAIEGGEDDAFQFIGAARFSGTAGELRAVFVDGQTYVSGDTDGDGRADFNLHLEGEVTLTASDFVF